MQRMIPHPQPLPPCRNGHAARHMHDSRAVSSMLDGKRMGGHLVECMCSQTGKHADYGDALNEWCRAQGRALPGPQPAAVAADNVRFIGRPQS